jgi:hypothetical protein
VSAPYAGIMGLHETDPRDAWRQSSERFIPAIVLIGLGTIFFLDNLHIVAIREVIRYWPAILIAVGIIQLVDSAFPVGRTVGGMLVAVGAFLLARNLGYLDIRVHDMWPLLLIGAGILMLLNRTGFWHAGLMSRIERGRYFRRWQDRQYVPGMLNEYAVFGGGKRKVNTFDFKGGHVDAVFGGFEIDLRDAIMDGGSAELELNAVFGGIEVRIPVTWSAVVQGVGVFGAFQDETTQPNVTLIPNPKRVIIKGAAVFGAVEVKN